MGLYKRKDSNVWWYRFTVNGNEYRGSTGSENKLDAEAFEIDERRKVRDFRKSTNTHVSGSILGCFQIYCPIKNETYSCREKMGRQKKDFAKLY